MIKVGVKILLKDPSELDAHLFVHEISLLASLEFHPNVINFIGHVLTTTPLMCIFEYCRTGNLLDYLHEVRFNFFYFPQS